MQPPTPPPTPGDGQTDYFGQKYWPRGYWGRGYWGSAETVVSPQQTAAAATVGGRKQQRRWLVQEIERSLLQEEQFRLDTALQARLMARRMLQEAEFHRLVELEQLEQARTAITTVFLAEV